MSNDFCPPSTDTATDAEDLIGESYQSQTGVLNTLCLRPISQPIVQAIVLGLIRHYMFTDKRLDSHLSYLVWTNTWQTTKVYINSATKQNVGELDPAKPQIIIGSGASKFLAEKVLETGTSEMLVPELEYGTTSVTVKSTNPLEAQILAADVCNYLKTCFLIMRRYGFRGFYPVVADAVGQETDDDKSVKVVPITLAWSYPRSLSVLVEDPVTRKIVLSTDVH